MSAQRPAIAMLLSCLLPLGGACASDDGATKNDSSSSPASDEAPTAATDSPAATTTTDWDWDGCSSELRASLILKCPEKRVTLSLGRVRAGGPVDDQMLLKAELDAVGGAVSAMQPDLADSVASGVATETMSVGDEPLSLTGFQLPENDRRPTLMIMATALPFEDEGEHFIVVYSCVTAEKQTCFDAVESLITKGPPSP